LRKDLFMDKPGIYTFSEENYLKAIFYLSEHKDTGVSTSDISGRLNTKASSVTDMVQKLSDKGLLTYEKYQGVHLTETGREVATRIIRKHRLWEVFLVEKLSFKWDEVHEMAEQLEHIQSKELTERLDAFLGYPQYDPHGDPIPDPSGSFPEQIRTNLSDFAIGDRLVVTGVRHTSPDFLQFLEQHKLELGTEIKVLEIFPYDYSMKLRIRGGAEISVSQMITYNLFVKKL
jgi:DtxR family transcriptional regulator, Mn-dependent transcriptional regulator